MSDFPETCEKCGTNLRGSQIPPEHIAQGYYAPSPDGSPRYFSRVIGIEVSHLYDGVLFWQCPDCDFRWHRWPEGHSLRAKAETLVSP
jgi:hypothetical protein